MLFDLNSNDVVIVQSNDIINSNQEQQIWLGKKHGGSCKEICKKYQAPRTVSGNRYAEGQARCSKCDLFLTPDGYIGDRKRCKCCNSQVRTRPRNSHVKENFFNEIQNQTQNNMPDIDSSKKKESVYDEIEVGKKSTPIYEQTDESVKTYYEFKEFLDHTMKLQSNYQLVILKELLEYGTLHKGEIAESLAYFNNKDSSNIDSVKPFLKVPVYEILTDHNIVNVNKDLNHIHHYSLNVKLNEFQKLHLLENLFERITNYNLEHNIPDNEFPNADNMGCINWSFSINKKLLMGQTPQNTIPEKIIPQGPSLWIWSVTPSNWEILKTKNVWGSKIPKERISEIVKSGDQIAFYVIGTNSFKGVYELDGIWFDSPGKTWDDDLESTGELRYKSQIKIKPILLGIALLSQLYEKMDVFKGKTINIRNLVLQGSGGYPSNNKRSLSKEDFIKIIDELKHHPESIPQPIKKTENLEMPQKSSYPSIESEDNSIISVKVNSQGIQITELKEIKSEIIKKGQILSNDELIQFFGVGNMGGIRYSRKNNILILCSTTSDDYHDVIDDASGLITYTGEGREGNQEVSKGNSKILNSTNTQMLFFKEKPQEPGVRKRGALDNLYEFVGKVNYLKHYWKKESGINGELRNVLKFVLEIES